MYRNCRTALETGTMLTEDICIPSLLSDVGGSSLVYKARKNGRATIIKEFYPYESDIEIVREDNRLIARTCSQDDIDKYQSQLLCLFANEMKNSQIANNIAGSNSVYSFPCVDINEDVQRNETFKGTLALYMEIETKSGVTLQEEIERLCATNQSQDVDFDQAILLTIKVLNTLASKHSLQHILHLDIKPDNVYFFDEPKWKDTICVLLDCGNYQPIEGVSPFSFSATPGYASFEVRKILKYIGMKEQSLVDSSFDSQIQKYAHYIGPQSDTYSVGMLFYQLLMGNELDKQVFEEMGSTMSNKKLIKLLTTSLEMRLEKRLSFVLDFAIGILCRALYIPSSYEDLINNRYTSCELFINDLNELLEIYEMRGMHPEILCANSRKAFASIVEFSGSASGLNQSDEDYINNEDLFDPRLFPNAYIIE